MADQTAAAPTAPTPTAVAVAAALRSTPVMAASVFYALLRPTAVGAIGVWAFERLAPVTWAACTLGVGNVGGGAARDGAVAAVHAGRDCALGSLLFLVPLYGVVVGVALAHTAAVVVATSGEDVAVVPAATASDKRAEQAVAGAEEAEDSHDEEEEEEEEEEPSRETTAARRAAPALLWRGTHARVAAVVGAEFLAAAVCRFLLPGGRAAASGAPLLDGRAVAIAAAAATIQPVGLAALAALGVVIVPPRAVAWLAPAVAFWLCALLAARTPADSTRR